MDNVFYSTCLTYGACQGGRLLVPDPKPEDYWFGRFLFDTVAGKCSGTASLSDYKLIEAEMLSFQKKAKNMAPEEAIDNIWSKYISLPYDFARHLSVGEVIDIQCFTPTEAIGRSLIRLIEPFEYEFVLSNKHYLSQTELLLRFEVVMSGYARAARCLIREGKI